MLRSTPLHASTLAPAKINLSLRIVGVRQDGYHLLDSCMVPISLYDRLDLTFVPAVETVIRCRTTQPGIPEDEANLAGKAARMFLDRSGITGAVSIRIEKSIPCGAGLGGGSSDAAAVLRMLDEGLAVGVGLERLASWSIEIGSDVPFFVHGRPARVRGVGELVMPSEPILSALIVVAFAGTELSTAAVYQAYDRSLTRAADLSSDSDFARGQRPFREMLLNDLEAAATGIHPSLRLLKARLFDLGACGALMTGSGSAMFGVWEERVAAEAAAAALRTTDGIWAKCVEIIEETPKVEILAAEITN